MEFCFYQLVFISKAYETAKSSAFTSQPFICLILLSESLFPASNTFTDIYFFHLHFRLSTPNSSPSYWVEVWAYFSILSGSYLFFPYMMQSMHCLSLPCWYLIRFSTAENGIQVSDVYSGRIQSDLYSELVQYWIRTIDFHFYSTIRILLLYNFWLMIIPPRR